MRIRALLLSLAVLLVGGLAATFLTSTGASGAVAVTVVKPNSAAKPCSATNVGRFCAIPDSGYIFRPLSSENRTPGFWKGTDGLVHLQGMARAPYPPGGGETEPAGTYTVFYLPKELRPTLEVVVPALECTTFTPTFVQIDATGAVSAKVGNSHCVDFDGVSFRR